MREMMNKLVEKLLLKEKVIFRGSFEELESRINRKNGEFSVEWISRKEFIFWAHFSFGTSDPETTSIFTSKESSKSRGIEGYGYVNEIEANHFEIELKTKLKSGAKFLIIIIVVFIFVQILLKENISIWGYLIFAFVFIFFKIVTRVQENYLFEAIKFEINAI